MNNKGQSLVTFVILLPIILLVLGMIIELGFISYEKSKIISVTKSIIANAIEQDKKDDIILLYDKNGINVEDSTVKYDDGITIEVTSKVDSFLGSVIGKEDYTINIKIKGYKKNNKIYYEKG